MRRILPLMMLGPAVLLATGCRDGSPAAVENHPALDATSAAALASLGPGWRMDPSDPHACFVSVAAKQGSIPYLYRRISLRLPASVQANDGAVAAFRVRDATPDGRVTAVLNCVIPATLAARRLVIQSFGVPVTAGAATADTSCMTDSKDYPCPIRGITATSKPIDHDPCMDTSTCYDDPGTGGGWTPTFPTDGGGDSGGTGGTDPCANCGPNAPIMSCTAVPRGSTTRCSVNAGDANVASWVWTDDSTNMVQGPGNTAAWSGTAVRSGTVSVYLTDGSTLQGTLTVSDRGWTWAKDAVSEYTDGTGPQCIDHTPTFGVRNGLNLPMGATNCDVNQRMIQPDSYDPVGDGFQATTVPDGPNHGLHYIVSARLYLRRQSTYNRGMLADAATVPLGSNQQICGIEANWFSFTRCMGDNPDAYVAGAHAHEGYGSTGHNGHFSAAYDAVAAPGNDPMVYFDQAVGDPTTTLQEFIEDVREEFHGRAEKADIASLDLANGGTVVTGNYSGPYWGWIASSGYFLRSATSQI